MPLNMKKQWRAELFAAQKHRRVITRTFLASAKALLRQLKRERVATGKITAKLDRRIAILEGRLS
jgi:hypothetical protein